MTTPDHEALSARVSTLLGIALEGIPHVAFRVRPGHDLVTPFDVVVEHDSWSASLNRVSQTHQVDLRGVAVRLAHRGADLDADACLRSLEAGDEALALSLYRTLFAGWAEVQRARVDRAAILGMTQPGPRISPHMGRRNVRVDHLSVDILLAGMLDDEGIDIGEHVRRTLPLMDDPRGAMSARWMIHDEDGDPLTSINDLDEVIELRVNQEIREGVYYDGGIVTVDVRVGMEVPETVATAAAGRPLGDLVSTGTDLDARVVRTVVTGAFNEATGEDAVQIGIETRTATLGELGFGSPD